MDKYLDPVREIKKLSNMLVTVIPIVIGEQRLEKVWRNWKLKK